MTKEKQSAPAEKVAIIVVAMHRSGTSALAGVLARMGCDLPVHLMEGREDNPKGFYEGLAFYHLNNEALASAGSSWNDWLPFNANWHNSTLYPEFLDRLGTRLEQELGESRFFVVKDPRIARLSRLWIEGLQNFGARPCFVLTLRSPLEVAASLATRNGIPKQFGTLLWLRYHLDAEAGTRGQKRSFTSYDRMLSNWAGEVEKFSRDLDFAWPRALLSASDEIGEFIDGKLKRQVAKSESLASDPSVSRWIVETYNILSKWAEQGEDPSDHEALDRIRAALDETAPLFSGLSRYWETLKSTQDELAKANETRLHVDHQFEQAQQRIKALEDNEAAMKDMLSRKNAELEDTQSQIAVKEQSLQEIDAELKQSKAETADTANRAKTEIETLSQHLKQEHAEAVDKLKRAVSIKEQEYDRVLLQWQAESKDKRYVIAEQDKALSAMKAEQARLRKKLKETNEAAKEVRSRLAKRNNEIAKLVEVKKELNAVLGSTSWRLTRPLRQAVLLLRRVKGRQD